MANGFQPSRQFIRTPKGSVDRDDRLTLPAFDQEPELRPIPNMGYSLLYRLQNNTGTDMAPSTGNQDSITISSNGYSVI